MTTSQPGTTFARRVFFWAGIYGMLVAVPQYFMEAKFNLDNPPAVTHPEFYYGFFGLVFVWQLAFILMSRNPLRYRPLMLIAVLEKASFGIVAPILYFTRGIPETMLAGAVIDIILGLLFFVAYQRTATAAQVYEQTEAVAA